MTAGASKEFFDKTGLDLECVFADYLEASIESQGVNLISRMQIFAKLHSRSIASQALHCIIKPVNDGVSLAEIEDGTYRVSWQLNEKPDDLSEPWPIVMLLAAYEINQYANDNVPKKKEDT